MLNRRIAPRKIDLRNPLFRDILAYYPLSDDGTDLTGNFPGTISGTLTPMPSPFGRSLYFNGTDSVITTSSFSNSYFLNTSYSFAVWVKVDRVSATSRAIFGKLSFTNGIPIYILINTGGIIQTQVGNAGGAAAMTRVSDVNLLNIGWALLSGTITTNSSSTTGQNISVYVNGKASQKALSNVVASNFNSDTLQIGKGTTGSNFLGQLSHAMIFARGLTDGDHAELYNLTRPDRLMDRRIFIPKRESNFMNFLAAK